MNVIFRDTRWQLHERHDNEAAAVASAHFFQKNVGYQATKVRVEYQENITTFEVYVLVAR